MLPFEHIIIIDRESRVPVYRQVAHALIHAIRTGILGAGAKLPGSRELAALLGVHRKTVVAAYEELNAQDWITVVPRKHVQVSDHIPPLRAGNVLHRLPGRAFAQDFSLPFRAFSGHTAAEEAAREIVIDDGHPDVRLSPIDELLSIYRAQTLKKYTIRNAHAGTAQGTLQLREMLVRHLSETRGLNVSPENILITHGAQMSIYLASGLLLDARSRIVVGRPGYTLAGSAFEAAGGSLVEVDVDAQGIDTAAIEAICRKQKISAVYVIPHHHYPTTVTLSVERRMQLLELSRKYSFAIIEDDYDYDYHYSSAPYLPLASGGHTGNVLYTGSFSKMLDPSLRIGFMVAPANFIGQAVALRRLIDAGGDGYMQNALAMLIGSGELGRHLKKARKIYHRRRDLLDKLLREQLGGYAEYSVPSGGMAFWIRLLEGADVVRLRKSRKISISRLDGQHNAFRFGFASMNEHELERAVAVLAQELGVHYEGES